jgi:hypothetical protein
VYVLEQGAEESTWGSNGKKSNNETEKKLYYDDPHYLYGDHIKMHEMGETCGTHECVLGFGGGGVNVKKGANLKDLVFMG